MSQAIQTDQMPKLPNPKAMASNQPDTASLRSAVNLAVLISASVGAFYIGRITAPNTSQAIAQERMRALPIGTDKINSVLESDAKLIALLDKRIQLATSIVHSMNSHDDKMHTMKTLNFKTTVKK